MADRSPFTFEERIVTSMWVHERHNTGDTLDTISANFKERFKKNPPTRKTMSNWESKLFETGYTKDASRSGRPVKCRELCESLEQSTINFPLKTTRKRLAELDIPQTTMMSYMKKNLEVKAWWPSFVNELSGADRKKRKLVCDKLKRIFIKIPV